MASRIFLPAKLVFARLDGFLAFDPLSPAFVYTESS
jgi:hypothetical protein